MDGPPDKPRAAMHGGWQSAIGPGILYAGAAIGVSHLVQSTRAGALHGLALLGVVLLAHVFKYPAMVFGPLYAASTGTSLVAGYRRRGRWALTLFTLMTLATMFIIQAAVTVVTAGLALVPLGETGAAVPLWAASAAVLGVCMALLAAGGFRWLDRVLKALMVLLLVITLAAAITQLPAVFRGVGSGDLALWPEASAWLPAAAFVAALVGWMPAPVDIAVWQSIWTLEKRRESGHKSTCRECRLDFHIGYGLCIVTACCFLLLGATLLHTKGVEPAEGAVGFVRQVIDLYADSIGAWVRPIVGVGALAVMFSTTLTVFDAIPRTIAAIAEAARSHDTDGVAADKPARRGYWATLIVLAIGAVGLIAFVTTRHTGAWKTLLDVATTIAFLSTPVLALLNHLAITGPEVPPIDRPGRGMQAFSWVCVVVWAGFAVGWVWIAFVG